MDKWVVFPDGHVELNPEWKAVHDAVFREEEEPAEMTETEERPYRLRGLCRDIVAAVPAGETVTTTWLHEQLPGKVARNTISRNLREMRDLGIIEPLVEGRCGLYIRTAKNLESQDAPELTTAPSPRRTPDGFSTITAAARDWVTKNIRVGAEFNFIVAKA